MAIWGYILDMPGRPKAPEQRRVLAALGVDMSLKGTCWADRVKEAKRHVTAGQTQLEERNALLLAVQPGDRVIVADPRCVGFSDKDAAWFVAALAERQVALTVNGDLWHIEPGEDASGLCDDVARLLRNARVAKSRGKV